MKLEKDLEKQAVVYAASKGVPSNKFTSPGRRGANDRIFWIPAETPSRLNGSPWLVEFKRPNGVVRKHQELFGTQLRKLGYRSTIVWTYEDFCYQLDEILSRGA